MTVISPLTKTENVSLEKEVSTDHIIKLYKSDLNIDVQRFFEKTGKVYIYKCEETNFRFYYPFDTEGDGKLYEELQKHPWYYTPWKWEHEVTRELIKNTDKVLEIGCAEGSFLEELKKSNIDCIGLELNEKAVEIGLEKNIKIIKKSIQEFALSNKEVYDVVCSFQVMEHIAEIKEVIDSSVAVLKKGGKLIISVPNNDSFLRYQENHTLNYPPHHMGLWDELSLKSLEKLFSLKLDRLLYEPELAHFSNQIQIVKVALLTSELKKSQNRYKFLGWFVYKIKSILGPSLSKKYPTLASKTVTAVYTKLF